MELSLSYLKYQLLLVYIALVYFCCLTSTQTFQSDDHWYYENIALGKPSVQNGTKAGRVASMANDGNPSGNFYRCSMTLSRINTWWLVDLLNSHYIYAVRMQNLNSNHWVYLNNFYIYVSETNPLPINGNNLTGEICLFHPSRLPYRGLQFLPCENNKVLKGRYVYVWKPIFGYLFLCEFEVLTKYPFRDFTFTLMKDKQTEIESFHTEMLVGGTTAQCSTVCLNIAKATIKLMQFDKNNGICSCFETKPFDDLDGRQNVTANPRYDIIGSV